MCPGKVWDPYSPLVWFGAIADEVARDALAGGKEHLEMPHADAGSSMQEEGHSEATVRVDALEKLPEGAYQDVRERAVIDVICLPQLLQAKGVPRLRHPWSRGGGHGLPVPGRKGARLGSPT